MKSQCRAATDSTAKIRKKNIWLVQSNISTQSKHLRQKEENRSHNNNQGEKEKKVPKRQTPEAILLFKLQFSTFPDPGGSQPKLQALPGATSLSHSYIHSPDLPREWFDSISSTSLFPSHATISVSTHPSTSQRKALLFRPHLFLACFRKHASNKHTPIVCREPPA